MTYASFWKRTAAYLLDAVLYGTVWGILQIILLAFGMGKEILSPAESATNGLIWLLYYFAGFLIYLTYYVWMESSSWQATIGKKVFGLKVTDLNGQRISFWRSLGRHLGMIVSGIILYIGYLMCLWTEKKQCLHDKLADCLVIDTKPNEKQGCLIAGAIGGTILIVLLTIGILAAISLPQYTKAVEMSRAGEAIQTLHSAEKAQVIHLVQHGYRVKTWKELNIEIPCTIQENPSLCSSTAFVYELSPRKTTATRTRGQEKVYTLTFTPDIKLTCDGKIDFGNYLCKMIMERVKQ